MLNENYEQTSNANSGFVLNDTIYEQFELLPPDEPLTIVDNPPRELNPALDDYFMELELDFDDE